MQKIVIKIFADVVFLPLLCTRFHLLSGVEQAKKFLKKVLKFFERKIWRFQINLLPLQPLSPKNDSDCEKVLKKIFQNIFEKDLADSKIVLTFAPLSALKNRKPKIRILDYGLKIKLRSLRILSS